MICPYQQNPEHWKLVGCMLEQIEQIEHGRVCEDGTSSPLGSFRPVLSQIFRIFHSFLNDFRRQKKQFPTMPGALVGTNPGGNQESGRRTCRREGRRKHVAIFAGKTTEEFCHQTWIHEPAKRRYVGLYIIYIYIYICTCTYIHSYTRLSTSWTHWVICSLPIFLPSVGVQQLMILATRSDGWKKWLTGTQWNKCNVWCGGIHVDTVPQEKSRQNDQSFRV